MNAREPNLLNQEQLLQIWTVTVCVVDILMETLSMMVAALLVTVGVVEMVKDG